MKIAIKQTPKIKIKLNWIIIDQKLNILNCKLKIWQTTGS